MKILHIIPNLVKGGAQRIAIDICLELQQREGIEVILVYFEGENEFSFLTKDLNIQKIDLVYNLSFRKRNQINIESFERLVDHFQPHVIHSHLYLAEIIAHENPRQEIAYFTHCHDNIKQLNRHKARAIFKKEKLIEAWERRRLLQRYSKCNKSFIAIAKDGVEFLKQNLPISLQQDIIFLPNAINVEAFKSSVNQIKHTGNLVNVGNFIPKKNQSFLIDVLSKLISHGSEAHLTLVGDGVTKFQVEAKAREQKVESHTDFKGKTDDVKAVLLENSIYVHSALYEPFGLVLLEAMAAGLPVVSLDGKGNRDVIQDGINGFLVEQGDLNRFVQCIIDLLTDSELYNKFQQEGYKTALKHDIKPYVDQLLELYKSKS